MKNLTQWALAQHQKQQLAEKHLNSMQAFVLMLEKLNLFKILQTKLSQAKQELMLLKINLHLLSKQQNLKLFLEREFQKKATFLTLQLQTTLFKKQALGIPTTETKLVKDVKAQNPSLQTIQKQKQKLSKKLKKHLILSSMHFA